MEGLGKILLIIGAVIIVVALLMIFGQHIPFFGKLPGDIFITFLIISIILTVIINLILYFMNR